jgi:SAM-dependent methyltransferase
MVISEVDRYGLPLNFVVCAACGTMRIDPYLESHSLEDFYGRFFQKMYGRATDIEAYFQKQSMYGEKILALTKDWLKPGSLVCELGCGAGGALNVFQKNGYRVTGCDYSPELIAAGKSRGLGTIYEGSLKNNPGGPAADLIYLHHVFEHVDRPLELLRECRKQLAPGGRIIVIVPDVSRIDRSTFIGGDLLVFLHIAHKYNFSFEGLRRLAIRAGFDIRRMEPDSRIPTPWSGMGELWIEFVPSAALSDSPKRPATLEHENYGAQMLNYLKRTEKLFSLGLCRGQLMAQLLDAKHSIQMNVNRIRRVTPAKIIHRLRKV